METDEIKKIVKAALDARDELYEAEGKSVRAAVDQAIMHAIDENLTTKIDQHVSHILLDVEAKLNRRLIIAVFANAVPILIGAFFLGGLWVQFAGIPTVLEGRAKWMGNVETRLVALENHAEKSDPIYRKPDTFIVPD